MKVTNKMQLYRLIYFSLSALHVSGDIFAHYQEHLTVFTVSGSIHCNNNIIFIKPILLFKIVKHITSNYNLVIAVNTTRYYKYSQVLLMMGENIA